MGITVNITGGSGDRKFEPITNLFQPGVLADIVDLGEVPNKFKPGTTQRKVRFVWLVDEEDTNGYRKRVFQRFTLSLHEKASLRKFVATLGYKDIEDIKKLAANLDVLIGTARMLVLNEEDGTEGRKFFNITATMPIPKGGKLPAVPKDFVRAQDKTEA